MNCFIRWIVPPACLLVLLACGETRNAKDRPAENGTNGTVVKTTALKKPVDTNTNPYEPVDVSPMDMSYFPAHYPLRKLSGRIAAPPVMRLIYSRPHLQGRKLFSGILKYDEPWRLGANEATELDIYSPVYINNNKMAPGRYSLYAIPHEKSWTVILNSDLDNWGLKPDSTKDVFRVSVPATSGNPRIEYFTMVFEKTDAGADLVIAWDDVLARVPFSIK